MAHDGRHADAAMGRVRDRRAARPLIRRSPTWLRKTVSRRSDGLPVPTVNSAGGRPDRSANSGDRSGVRLSYGVIPGSELLDHEAHALGVEKIGSGSSPVPVALGGKLRS